MNRAPITSAGAGSGSYKSYAAGFILSVVLTVIAFGLVMSGVLPRRAVLFGIFGAAVVQMLVHLHYFLHLNSSSENHWNVAALIFTILIMVIFVGGSIWIMYSLNYRMM
jgi:cytochrome o ubiquinol oxidase operon protein cyoD